MAIRKFACHPYCIKPHRIYLPPQTKFNCISSSLSSAQMSLIVEWVSQVLMITISEDLNNSLYSPLSITSPPDRCNTQMPVTHLQWIVCANIMQQQGSTIIVTEIIICSPPPSPAPPRPIPFPPSFDLLSALYIFIKYNWYIIISLLLPFSSILY